MQTKQTSKRKAKNVLLSMRLWVKPTTTAPKVYVKNAKNKDNFSCFKWPKQTDEFLKQRL
ncbi:hypothetical protein HMPREF9420_1925 [Segatella salivae DSM 15606]|uniref:Uncharacterized protein n=1 Tax=Segatella salivae DSM 15606 TaxID=888832 RepID=E6MR07_9BACT|nr:hypothetical protein HMPREF9420_1925 [Segatella salivae DSM 15606]